MDIASICGITLALFGIVAGMLMEGGSLSQIAQPTAALIVLSHDPHVDTPVLETALSRAVPYVGALGSRATQTRRLDRLRAAGVDAADLDRIHRPIGLDLGGRRASEVALSIAAEILAESAPSKARLPVRSS